MKRTGPQWAVGMGAAAIVCGSVVVQLHDSSEAKPASGAMKVYSRKDMLDMVDDGKLVMAYKGDVFDVSEFTGHPGGVGRLQMAAGGDLEVFWTVYTQHNRGHINDVMAPYKIGRLSPADMEATTRATAYDSSQYEDNPEPYPDLLTNTRYPYNAEGRLATLTDSFITPIGKHFVRNHSAVPNIDPEEYTLTVNGYGLNETVFTLKDLKTKFEKVSVTTVIQCNGNRREDFHYLDGKTPAFGPPHWVAGAIGCSTWSGVRLRDVLREAGMDVDSISLGKKEAHEKAQQIGLLAYDHDEVGNQYCCSFPFDKAIDPFGDVIIAYEMNGEDIPRSHGYPVRSIVPGHAGARNCKFLEMVTVTDEPCAGHGNWKQYAVHAPDVAMRKIANFGTHKKELMEDPAVQEMPVQSLITSPAAGDILSAVKRGDKTVKVKGIAWGGGGSGVNRVDVSLNNGKDFTRADVLDRPAEIKQKRRSQWAWVFFEKEIPIPEDMQSQLQSGKPVDMVLTSKALNAAWNVQPSDPEPNRNAHGCCVNHWYRVPITVCPKAPDDIKAPEGDYANKPSGGRFMTPFRNLDHPVQAEERRSKSMLAQKMNYEPDDSDACTCGAGCLPGQGCLRPMFDASPSRLMERNKAANLATLGRPADVGMCHGK